MQPTATISPGSSPWLSLPASGRLAAGLLALAVFVAVFVPLAPLPSPRLVDTSRTLEPPLAGAVVERLAGLAAREGEQPGVWIERNFGSLGPFSRLLVRARVALFGDLALSGLLGRDELGRDLLARVAWGAAVDVLDSIPLVFLVVFLVTVLGEDSVRLALDSLGIGRLAIFFCVVGAVSWLSMARIVRGRVLSLRDASFVEAARAAGAGPLRMLFRHVVPNLVGTVVVTLSLTVPRVMLFESFLSFLGLGVQPPDVSWGLLANAGLRALVPIQPAWWLFVFPCAALAVTLLALGFLGDALEAALDPRRRR